VVKVFIVLDLKTFSFLPLLPLRGCTSHAMPMLTMYNATMGAAKMHMFKMSVVA